MDSKVDKVEAMCKGQALENITQLKSLDKYNNRYHQNLTSLESHFRNYS